MKTILLAYDGSAPADKAHAWAVDLAAQYGAQITILTVNRPPEFSDNLESEAVLESGRRHCWKMLRSLEEKTHATGLRVHFEVADGHPAEQIIQHAEKLHADLVVMGHRGSGLLSRWLIGSAVRQVIAHAHCAVTVVR